MLDDCISRLQIYFNVYLISNSTDKTKFGIIGTLVLWRICENSQYRDAVVALKKRVHGEYYLDSDNSLDTGKSRYDLE